MDIPGDASKRGAVLVMTYKDGSGQLLRRSLIDEEQVTEDWRTWDATQDPRP